MASLRTASRRPHVRLCLEQLEARELLSGVPPTAVEQVFLERLNDARANPAAYGAAIGVDLSSIAPAQPLAWDPRLIASALGHSQDMNARNYFAHNTPEGVDPGGRMSAQGFPWQSWGESIAGGSAYATPEQALSGLIIDAGVPDLGHRMHLLGVGSINSGLTQVGIGIVQNGTGNLTNYYTIDSASTADKRAFITGVVYNDANGNGVYDAGEGFAANITISGVGSFATYDTGGYSVPVSPGTYTVVASGGSLTAPITTTISVGSQNVRLNFTTHGAQGGSVASGLNDVANLLAHSTESYQHFVTQAYQTYLKRTPDAAGLSFWVTMMAHGTTDEQIEGTFIGSAEYIAAHGGTNAPWVTGMYQDLLGRTPAAGEVSYWVGLLGAGALTPTQVAQSFAASAERETIRIQADYHTYLGRSADQSGVNYWVGQFLQGVTNESVIAGFAASPEYYNGKAKGDPSAWVVAVYPDVLHRAASAAEISYWASQI